MKILTIIFYQPAISDQNQLVLEKELAIAKTLVKKSAKCEAYLQSQVETLRHSLRTTETKAVVLEAQQQEAQK